MYVHKNCANDENTYAEWIGLGDALTAFIPARRHWRRCWCRVMIPEFESLLQGCYHLASDVRWGKGKEKKIYNIHTTTSGNSALKLDENETKKWEQK